MRAFAEIQDVTCLQSRCQLPFLDQLEDGSTSSSVTKRERNGNVTYQVESWFIDDDEYLKHGKEMFVNMDGVVYRQRIWDNDVLHGPEWLFDQTDRNLIMQRQWRNGLLHGVEEEFVLLQNRRLYKFAQRFYDEGKLHGNENRQILIGKKAVAEESTHWVNGRRHGLSQTRRLVDNRLMKETLYDDGKRQGKATEYFRNGKIRRLEMFCNDKKHGTFYSFGRNGSVRYLRTYEDGHLNGVQLKFNKSGQLLTREKWYRGIMMSRFITEHADERLLFGDRTFRFEDAS